MSESAGRACAWQERHFDDLRKEWGQWRDCSNSYFTTYGSMKNYETRALVPEQLLVEAERFSIVRLRSQEKAIERLSLAINEYETLQAKVRALAGELFAKADEFENAHYRQTGYEIDFESKGRASAYSDAAEMLTALTEKSEETR